MPQISARHAMGCFVFLLVVAVLAAYWTVGSINPLHVYSSDGLAGKIVVSVMLFLAASMVLSLIGMWSQKATIRAITKMPPEDVRCPGCGDPLLAYVSLRGMPRPCPKCKKYWHMQCFKTGRPEAPRVMGALCPTCLKEVLRGRSDENDWLGDGPH